MRGGVTRLRGGTAPAGTGTPPRRAGWGWGLGGAKNRLRAPGLESLFVATFALLGLRLGAQPIGDNSAFVHLRVGIDLLSGNGIPRRDPYSFTAQGEPWVVQSWLADFLYGLAHRLAGIGGVVVEQGLLLALLAWLLARLSRAGSPLRTLASAGIATGMGVLYWSPRPLVFGLLGLALTVTVVERRLSPWWLVPIAWLWVNTHGSFVLGLVWLLAIAVGEVLDRRGEKANGPLERVRYLPAFAVGLVAAAANPLGPRLLTFALTVLEKREIFRAVNEWRSPSFQHAGGLLTLACLVATVVVLARSRPRWADLVPAAGFLGLGLLAQRNLAMAGVVVAPALARALRPREALARREPRPAGPTNTAIAAVIIVAAVIFVVGALRGPGLDLEGYPVAALARAEQQGPLPARRVVTTDVVGGYLILRHGRSSRVFIDDRVDMYPVAVSRDYRTLLDGGPGSPDVLDRHRIDAVVWPARRSLVAILQATGDWDRSFAEDGWVLLRRRSGLADDR